MFDIATSRATANSIIKRKPWFSQRHLTWHIEVWGFFCVNINPATRVAECLTPVLSFRSLVSYRNCGGKRHRSFENILIACEVIFSFRHTEVRRVYFHLAAQGLGMIQLCHTD